MDLRTLLLANCVLMMFDVAALWSFSRAYPSARGIADFIRWALSTAVAGALIRLAEPNANALLFGLGSGLLVLGFVFFNQGIAVFWSRPRPRRRLHYSLAVVTGVLCFHFNATHNDPGPYITIVGTALALELSVGAGMFWRAAEPKDTSSAAEALKATRPGAWVLGLFALFNLVRGPWAWLEQGDLNRELWVVVISAYAFLLFWALIGLSLVWMIIVDLRTRLGQLARTDDLTGLLNRGALDLAAEEMLARVRSAAPPGEALSLLLMDLDHFKQLNDRFGHPTGDQALLAVASHLQSSLRSGDVAARLGGEEFVLLLPGLDAAAAGDLAERLRRGIEALQLVHRDSKTAHRTVAFTASFGIAALQDAAEEWPSLLQRADAALYEAKQSGRNCVRVATGAAVLGTPAEPTGV